MPIDPFDPGTSVAQHFPTQEPDTLRRLAQIIAAQKREMFDLRASVLANVSDVVADLTTQQATLTAQVAAIAAQNAQILALIGAQVTGDTNTTFASGVSLIATPQSIAAVSVTVPVGFSIARIMAISALATGDSVVNCQTRIQGSDGGALTGVHGVASSAHAITLTGLSGGTITASTLAGSIPNTTGDMANTTIFAMFFR